MATLEEIVSRLQSGSIDYDEYIRQRILLGCTATGAAGIQLGIDFDQHRQATLLGAEWIELAEPKAGLAPVAIFDPSKPDELYKVDLEFLVGLRHGRVSSITCLKQSFVAFDTSLGGIGIGTNVPLFEPDVRNVMLAVYRSAFPGMVGVPDDEVPIGMRLIKYEDGDTSYLSLPGITFSLSSDRGTLYQIDFYPRPEASNEDTLQSLLTQHFPRLEQRDQFVAALQFVAAVLDDKLPYRTFAFFETLCQPAGLLAILLTYDDTSASLRATSLLFEGAYSPTGSYHFKRQTLSIPAQIHESMTMEFSRGLTTEQSSLYGIRLGASVSMAPEAGASPVTLGSKMLFDVVRTVDVEGAVFADTPISQFVGGVVCCKLGGTVTLFVHCPELAKELDELNSEFQKNLHSYTTPHSGTIVGIFSRVQIMGGSGLASNGGAIGVGSRMADLRDDLKLSSLGYEVWITEHSSPSHLGYRTSDTMSFIEGTSLALLHGADEVGGIGIYSAALREAVAEYSA